MSPWKRLIMPCIQSAVAWWKWVSKLGQCVHIAYVSSHWTTDLLSLFWHKLWRSRRWNEWQFSKFCKTHSEKYYTKKRKRLLILNQASVSKLLTSLLFMDKIQNLRLWSSLSRVEAIMFVLECSVSLTKVPVTYFKKSKGSIQWIEDPAQSASIALRCVST